MAALLSESDDLVALSALQHLLYCERQAALIHVERAWREDGNTASGRILHERADLPGVSGSETVRSVRAVELRSARLRVAGRADVVEYHRDEAVTGGWRPYPVEYKHGLAKFELGDRVQLCAQAICLEEMHGLDVPAGALFYGQAHRRVEVVFDNSLRRRTEAAAERIHELIRTGRVPAVAPAPKCRKCSLLSLCLPAVTSRRQAPSEQLAKLLREEGGEPC